MRSPLLFARSGLAVVMILLASGCDGCSDVEVVDDGGGGEGGDGAASSSSTGMLAEGQVTSVRAPTRTTIEIGLAGDMSTAPTDPSAFVITGELGGVTVTAATLDEAGKKLVLTTEKQKLGVEYDLVIQAPGSQIDQEGGTFPSADTATFWATDLDSFEDYEVTAERLVIGDRVVIYATDDVSPTDEDETAEFFDTVVFPVETELFTDAPDRDNNGKILILGLDGHGQYGGYFSPLNAMSAEDVEPFGYHSNEMEMLYVSVPDLGDSFDPVHVVSHEFLHLLYNETHDPFGEDWAWHNEGLAECAVHAVNGVNEYARYYYVNYPELQQGKSLVLWDYGNYAQYVQAYAFLTYAASRLGGVQGYGQLFDLSGAPADAGALFEAQLGKTFPEVHLDMLAAAWAQAPTGIYGFSGMVDFPNLPLALTVADAPQSLSPFEGIFFTGAPGPITPTAFGPDVRFIAVDAQGVVDVDAPFEATGGAIIALNANQDASDPTPQPSGMLGSAVAPGGEPPLALMPLRLERDRAWLHPPPVKPGNRRLLEQWRRQTRGI